MDLSQQTKPYPRYLYHRDFNEPKIVNSKVEEIALGTKGWGVNYIHKDYPKWVDNKIVRSKEEEERLLVECKPLIEVALDAIERGPASKIEEFPEPPEFPEIDPVVVKETRIDNQDTVVVEKPKKGRPKK